jgi:hypothetical protein
MSGDKASLQPPDEPLWSLVEALVEGTADEVQRNELDRRLRADAAARRFYVEYLDLHAQLQWRTRGRSDGTAQSKNQTKPATRQLVIASLGALASLATAAAVFIALFMPRQLPEESQTPELPTKPAGAVAVVIESGPAVWEPTSSRPKVGSYLLPGRLKLKSGVVEVALERGGKIVLEGPADLDVSSADRGFLHQGKLAAKVTDRSAPLILNLPGGVANIDGECGLLFDAQGRPELHVFNGEARANLSDTRGVTLPGGRLIEHAAAAIDSQQHLLADVPLNFVAFASLRPSVWISDAAVRDGGHADENFGAAPQLVVKNSIPGYSWETFLRFDLSGVKGPIRDATVRLVPIKVGQTMENAAAVVPSGDIWSEQLITWDTKPPSGPVFTTWTVTEPKPIEFDVTQQAREALTADKRLVLRIFAPKRKRGSAYVQYASREGSPDVRPQLIITPAVELQTRTPWQADEMKNEIPMQNRPSDSDGLSWFAPRSQSGAELLIGRLKF